MPIKRSDTLDLSGIMIDKIATKEDKDLFEKEEIKIVKEEEELIYFTFDKDTIDFRNSFAKSMAEYISTNCSPNVKETMFTFYNRMLEYANKLALQSAILRDRKNKKISILDIEYGQEIIKRIFFRLIMWIENFSRTDKDTPVTSREKPANIILNNFIIAFEMLKKNKSISVEIKGKKFVPKTSLYKQVRLLTKKSSATVRQSYWPKIQKYFIEVRVKTFRYVRYEPKRVEKIIINDLEEE